MPSEPATQPGTSASAAGQFNDADVMFAQQMLLRHEQAVAISDMVLRKAGVHLSFIHDPTDPIGRLLFTFSPWSRSSNRTCTVASKSV